MFDKTKSTLAIIILILLAGNIYSGVQYFSLQKELNKTKSSLEVARSGKKYRDFNRMFIEKILRADGTVDIETRLELENAVRNLNDAEILAQWKKFTGGTSEKDSQEAVKNLLEMLAGKSAF